MKKILVTGACGYIGSHTVKALAEHGHAVYALDIEKSNNDISKYLQSDRAFIHKDVTKTNHGRKYFDVIVHLAGLLDIEESVDEPWKYINNNVTGTYNTIMQYPAENFIFASTAAAFNPVSPYAQTKILAETLIKRYCLNYTIFRFFNVAGNNGEFKQIGRPTHLVRIAAEAAAGKRNFITVNGTDWDTYDGTCVRDYIHVSDLVDGIVKAVYNPSNKPFECIGTGRNSSVRQVITTMKEVTGINFPVNFGPRRPGDTATVVVPPGLLSDYVSCSRTLSDMCLSAFKAELS